MQKTLKISFAVLAALLVAGAYLAWEQFQISNDLQAELLDTRISLSQARAGLHLQGDAPDELRLSWLYTLNALQLATQHGSAHPELWEQLYSLGSNPELFRERWRSPVPRQRAMYDAALSPDQSLLAVAAEDGKIHLFDTENFEDQRRIGNNPAPASKVIFDGSNSVVAGFLNGDITRFNLTSGEAVQEMGVHQSGVLALALSPSGSILASADQRGELAVRKCGSPEPLFKIRRAGKPILDLCFLSDKQLALSRMDGQVEVIEVATGKPVNSLNNAPKPVRALDYSKKHKRIFFGEESGKIYRWNWKSKDQPDVIFNTDDAIYSLHISHDEERLYIGTSRGSLIALTLESETAEAQFNSPLHGREINAIVEIPARGLMATVSTDQRLVIAEAATGKAHFRTSGHTRDVLSLALHPEGQILASGSRDNSVRLWEIDSGRELAVLDGHRGSVTCLDFNTEGNLLAAGDRNRKVVVWDWQKADAIFESPQFGGAVLALRFSPDSKMLYTIAEDDTLRIFEFRSGQLVRRHFAGLHGVISARFHPTLPLLAVSNRRHLLGLLHLGDRGRLEELTGHRGNIWGMDFSPDGNFLATTGEDSTVRIWPVGRENRNVKVIQTGERQKSVVFLPDGQALAVGGEKGRIQLWNDVNRNKLGEFGNHNRIIWSLLAHRTRNMLVSGGRDYSMRFWALPELEENHPVRFSGFLAEIDPDDKILNIGYSRQHPGRLVLVSQTKKYSYDPAADDQGIATDQIGSTEALALIRGLTAVPADSGVSFRELITDAVSPDRSTWAGFNGKTIQIYDEISGRIYSLPRSSNYLPQSLAVSAREKVIATGEANGTVLLQEWEEATSDTLPARIARPVSLLEFSPSGTRLAGYHRGGNRLSIWNLKQKLISQQLSAESNDITAICWIHDDLICAADFNGVIWIWKSGNGQLIAKLPSIKYPVVKMQYSEESKSLAVLTREGRCFLWDISLIVDSINGRPSLKSVLQNSMWHFQYSQEKNQFFPIQGQIPMVRLSPLPGAEEKRLILPPSRPLEIFTRRMLR